MSDEISGVGFSTWFDFPLNFVTRQLGLVELITLTGVTVQFVGVEATNGVIGDVDGGGNKDDGRDLRIWDPIVTAANGDCNKKDGRDLCIWDPVVTPANGEGIEDDGTHLLISGSTRWCGEGSGLRIGGDPMETPALVTMESSTSNQSRLRMVEDICETSR